jgi:hypothetical protein
MQALTKALLRRQALDTPQHGQEPGRGTGLTVKLNGPAEGKPLWLHAAAVCPAPASYELSLHLPTSEIQCRYTRSCESSDR